MTSTHQLTLHVSMHFTEILTIQSEHAAVVLSNTDNSYNQNNNNQMTALIAK